MRTTGRARRRGERLQIVADLRGSPRAAGRAWRRRSLLMPVDRLLIPLAHFGSAGGAGLLDFAAGRFLPFAGPRGSRWAVSAVGAELKARPGPRAPPPRRAAARDAGG